MAGETSLEPVAHLDVIHARVQEAERARIAEWLNAKADETEELLILAAERGDPTAKATQLWFAKKTRIVISVLASMVEQNTLALRAKGETP